MANFEALAWIAVLACAGCASSAPPPAPLVVSDCVRLTVKPYTHEFQARVLAARTDDPSPERDAMIDDYGQLRAEVRACRAL